jgi:hypothetical protein
MPQVMHGRYLTNAWSSLRFFFRVKQVFPSLKFYRDSCIIFFNKVQLEYKPNMKDVMGINLLAAEFYI